VSRDASHKEGYTVENAWVKVNREGIDGVRVNDPEGLRKLLYDITAEHHAAIERDEDEGARTWMNEMVVYAIAQQDGFTGYARALENHPSADIRTYTDWVRTLKIIQSNMGMLSCEYDEAFREMESLAELVAWMRHIEKRFGMTLLYSFSQYDTTLPRRAPGFDPFSPTALLTMFTEMDRLEAASEDVLQARDVDFIVSRDRATLLFHSLHAFIHANWERKWAVLYDVLEGDRDINPFR
jgi:hypothetical protein